MEKLVVKHCLFIHLFVVYLKKLLKYRTLHRRMIGYTIFLGKWKEAILVYK